MSKFMESHWLKGLVGWLKSLLPARPLPLSDIEQARRLIAAVDRGGIPLNPAKVNAIARNLGLEVAKTAAVEDTIARIRRALNRAS